MIEPKMNYKRYKTSLDNTPFTSDNYPPLKINYREMVQYAHQKGLLPCELSDKEKNMFLIQDEKSALG